VKITIEMDSDHTDLETATAILALIRNHGFRRRLLPNEVTDGHGNYYGPCERCNSQLEIVRPGVTRCPACGD
jgi:hypothetical protein